MDIYMSTIWEETILVYSGSFGYMAKLNIFWQYQSFHFCAQNKLFLNILKWICMFGHKLTMLLWHLANWIWFGLFFSLAVVMFRSLDQSFSKNAGFIGRRRFYNCCSVTEKSSVQYQT